MLSIIIITLNEEKNIARAIKSAQFADEVIVVDSNSSDLTVSIAKELGANVFTKEFLGYGQQKSYATTLCKHDWIFSLDADEEITPELRMSILSSINKSSSQSVFKVNRKTFFRGRWIKYGGWYPDYVARLYKKKEANWTQSNVHEVLQGTNYSNILPLHGDLNHFSFSTFMSQIHTNIRYAELGAKTLVQKNKKINIFKIILKSFWKFIECYLLKLGFLDGIEGFIIAVNASYSIFMKYTLAYFEEC